MVFIWTMLRVNLKELLEAVQGVDADNDGGYAGSVLHFLKHSRIHVELNFLATVLHSQVDL